MIYNNLNKTDRGKRTITILSAAIISILIVTLIFYNPFLSAWAQPQQRQEQLQEPNINNFSDINNTVTSFLPVKMLQFKVTFESVNVNFDHDSLFSGEWAMDAYVNREHVSLWHGIKSVDDGDLIHLNSNNTVVVNVPDNENGVLRIATLGFEDDVGYEDLQIFPELMDTYTSLPEYTDRVQQSITPLTTGYVNDPLGYVVAQFTREDNFGVGSHGICSDKNTLAPDAGIQSSNCDYEILFRIENVS